MMEIKKQASQFQELPENDRPTYSVFELLTQLTGRMVLDEPLKNTQHWFLSELKKTVPAMRASLWAFTAENGTGTRPEDLLLVASSSSQEHQQESEEGSGPPENLLREFWGKLQNRQRFENCQETVAGISQCLIPIVARRSTELREVLGFLGVQRVDNGFSVQEIQVLKMLLRDASLILESPSLVLE